LYMFVRKYSSCYVELLLFIMEIVRRVRVHKHTVPRDLCVHYFTKAHTCQTYLLTVVHIVYLMKISH